MTWDFSHNTTDELHEELKNLDKYKFDRTEGDAFRGICFEKQQHIKRELIKRGVAVPGEL